MERTRHQDTRTEGSILGSSVKGLLITAGVAAIANLGRKLAVQAPTAMAEDWCEGLAGEHKATLAVIDKLQDVTGDHPRQRAILLTNLTHMISKHALQEENVIYPVLRRGEDNAAAEAADSLNRDHGQVKAMLYELAHMDKGDPAFGETLGELRSALEEHMREEEDILFPALRTRLSDDENRKLTREMNMAGLMLA
ncbi:hemerythrin domain-containing protein [Blastomonas sp. AAP53]|uniref:hemerythrin domain-containing protein n=1 Tax=Blastomonas sp. AAP53 TaxID=1248760 RepID=UPI00030E439C|nr:hemerythrin domain-containing protein [Blastomonas sp. AAP53]